MKNISNNDTCKVRGIVMRKVCALVVLIGFMLLGCLVPHIGLSFLSGFLGGSIATAIWKGII